MVTNLHSTNHQGERYSMHVYVPKEKSGLNDLLNSLKNTSMDQIRGRLTKPGNCEEVNLSLPKFKIESELKLLEPLKQVIIIPLSKAQRRPLEFYI